MFDISSFFLYNIIEKIYQRKIEMKYELINIPNPQWDTITQILYNRGIPIKEIPHYLSLSD